jgi:hypothetical protein
VHAAPDFTVVVPRDFYVIARHRSNDTGPRDRSVWFAGRR